MASLSPCSGCNQRDQKIAFLEERLQFSQAEIDRLKSEKKKQPQENSQADPKLKHQRKPKRKPKQKRKQSHSIEAEEKRRQKNGKAKNPKGKQAGRKATEENWKLVDPINIRHIYPELPEGISNEKCKFAYQQVVLHLVNGKPVHFGYIVYQYKKKKGIIPNVLGRSKYGIDIVIEIGILIYKIGNSFSQVIETLAFFRELNITKSQIDSLMYQFSRHLNPEFDTLCILLANSAVVYADETGWSLKSAWVFLSEKARVLFFGVNKNGKTLKHILDKMKYMGILVCDDAAVYDNFSTVQRCWAHLLRKAIKHALENPKNRRLQQFKEELLEHYRKARRVQKDPAYSKSDRKKQVKKLEKELLGICAETYLRNKPKKGGWEKAHWLLVQEIIRLKDEQELYTFVTAPSVTQPNGETKAVGGTNNEAEHKNIPIADDRNNGQTSKSYKGCRRKSIMTSVFESLRIYLPSFTLRLVLAEICRWWETGESCFERMRKKMQLKLPESEESILDRVIPESKVA